MKNAESRVIAAIDREALLNTLCDMVAIQSLDGNETPVQIFVADLMSQMGLSVDRWELDFAELSRHSAFHVEVERPQGLGVVGTLGSDRGGRSLIFNGHCDVVPAGDLSNWNYPPWQGTVTEDRVYGRGAVDMKGGLCCALFAAKALQDAGIHLRGRLMVESVIGEEDGGCGTLATILRGYHADGAIVVEPTTLCIAPAQAGALNFRITVPGLSAHGCVREEGISAIEKFIPIQRALMELEHERNSHNNDPLFADYALPYALCIGTVRAGSWASSVAEELVCEGRFGLAIGENLATARQSFESAIAGVAAADPWLHEHPPRVEWWGGQYTPAALPAGHPLIESVGAAFQCATASAAHFEGMTYGSDMSMLANVGQTPALLFGPGDVRHAHRPDEYVPIADLLTVTRTLAISALRFCGYD